MIGKFLFNNAGLKFLSLIIAIFVWLYANAEIETVRMQDASAYKMVVKRIPIKVEIAGEVPAGYEIDKAGIRIRPADSVVIGPDYFLTKILSLSTVPIEINDLTQTFHKKVPIKQVSSNVEIMDSYVTLTIPVRKIIQAPPVVENNTVPTQLNNQ